VALQDCPKVQNLVLQSTVCIAMSNADMITRASASAGRKCLQWAAEHARTFGTGEHVEKALHLGTNSYLLSKKPSSMLAVRTNIQTLAQTRFQSLGFEKAGQHPVLQQQRIHLATSFRQGSLDSLVATSSNVPSTTPRCQSGGAPVHRLPHNHQVIAESSERGMCFSSDEASASPSSRTEGDDATDENGARVAVGSIHLIMGPMFAGKTTALLARMQDAVASGK
jgi:hypothetical protein